MYFMKLSDSVHTQNTYLLSPTSFDFSDQHMFSTTYLWAKRTYDKPCTCDIKTKEHTYFMDLGQNLWPTSISSLSYYAIHLIITLCKSSKGSDQLQISDCTCALLDTSQVQLVVDQPTNHFPHFSLSQTHRGSLDQCKTRFWVSFGP